MRALTAEHLVRFAMKTMTTWGSEADFKHFLPRLLELIALDELSAVEIVLGKLTYGRWGSWPDQEYAAVASFLHAWWNDFLERESLPDLWGPWKVATVLEGIAQAEHDLTPYLTRWAEIETPSAVQHLAAFVLSEAEDVVQGQLQGAYWTDREVQAQQVVRWLLNGRQEARLASAAYRQTEVAWRELFEKAARTLSIAGNST